MSKSLVLGMILTVAFATVGIYGAITVSLFGLLILSGKNLLVFSLYSAFFNFAQLDGAPFFAGLLGAPLALLIYMVKHPADFHVDFRGNVVFVLSLALSMVLVSNFMFFSWGKEFEQTAIKSLVQQLFFIYYVVFFCSLKPEAIRLKDSKAFKDIPVFVLFYGFVFGVQYLFNDDQRFGAALGPQGLALILTLLAFYFSHQRNFKVSFFIAALTVLTLSRTYILMQLFFLVTLYIYSERRKYRKVIYACLGSLLAAAVVAVVPLLSPRLNYYEKDFFGTLLGRMKGYESAVEMIQINPVFGSGVGSILLTLRSWSAEGYYYYRSSGDTTIVHNEYLRILVEAGVVGLALYSLIFISMYRRASTISSMTIIMFLVASLVENTLSLYSGPVIAFLMLVYMGHNKAWGRKELYAR